MCRHCAARSSPSASGAPPRLLLHLQRHYNNSNFNLDNAASRPDADIFDGRNTNTVTENNNNNNIIASGLVLDNNTDNDDNITAFNNHISTATATVTSTSLLTSTPINLPHLFPNSLVGIPPTLQRDAKIG